MKTLTDKQNRNVLGEGRNHQMGFAFCQLNKDGSLETVQPISPCKDYLNDIVYCEHMKIAMTAYGLKYSPQGIFKGTDLAYLAIKILPYMNGTKYGEFDKHEENLKNNIKNLQKFINYFDKAFALEKTIIHPSTLDGAFAVEFSQEWCKYTYTISLFSLLLRIGQFYDGKKTPVEHIKTFSAFAQDTYLVNSIKDKIMKLLDLKRFPELDMKTLTQGTGVHNFGIMAFNKIS